MDLRNKVVLVTGSSSGLGKATARSFLQIGAKVVICDINEARLREAEDELAKEGTVYAGVVDITNEDSVKALLQATVETYGGLDVLVNNAGIMDKFGMHLPGSHTPMHKY